MVRIRGRGGPRPWRGDVQSVAQRDVGGRHAFRFGVTADRIFSGKEWRALSRRIEDLGFATLLVSDHLGDQLSPVPALAAAAEATSVLRVGALVACNDFRHPVVHAKEVATLDVLSGGRADWGMGAGWLEPEYTAAGIHFDRSAVRVDRMQEAVAVMKGLFGDGPLNHDGQHYRVDVAEGYPKPHQRPHPPLLVGGAGKRMLTFAAREANIIGIAPSLTARQIGATPARDTVEGAADRQLGWVKAAAGDRFDDIELNMVVYPAIVADAREERAAEWSEFLGLSPTEVLASPHVWIGPVDQICESLTAYRERWGVSYWVVPATAVDAVAPVVARLAGR
jgi:probable F420-dependent oxidoreductase